MSRANMIRLARAEKPKAFFSYEVHNVRHCIACGPILLGVLTEYAEIS